MGKTNLEALLKQYNRELYRKNDEREETNVSAEGPKLASGSYASPVEYLLDKYRNDPNFDAEIFNTATELGEDLSYLSLIAQNAGQTMSEQFYDPKYRTYESAMLELYKGLADDETPNEEVLEYYDPVSQTWMQQSLGEMTERGRIQYDLDRTYAARDAEITRQLEQYRKDTMGFMQSVGSHISAVGMEFGEGVATALAGIFDIGGALGYATTESAIEKNNWLDNFVEYYSAHSMLGKEKEVFRASVDEYERKYTTFQDINGNITTAGKYVASIANSLGMMLPSIITAIPTGGTSFAWLGQASFYGAIFSGNVYDNATQADTIGSPSWVKITNAALTTSAEWVIEWGLGKILGGTIQNSLIGMGGKGLPRGITELSKLDGFKYLFKSAGQEGLEEFLQDFGTHCINAFTDIWFEGYGNDGVSLQTLTDAFFAGFLSSLVLSGAAIGKNKMASLAANAKAKKKGEYDLINRIGPGDMVIETEAGKYEKIGGARRLYYSSILSDFQDAVKTLEASRGNIKDIKLAQQVYTGMTQLAQFYASFDKTRFENCQRLLDRVIGLEKAATSNPAKSREFATKKFAADIGETLRELIGSPYKSAAINALTKKLQDGGVNNVTGSANAEKGKKRAKKKDAGPSAADLLTELGKTATEVAEEETSLSTSAEAKLDRLLKDYEWVFTTDGHTAVEDGNSLFVSEAWLENYSTSEIYKFLVQSDILGKLAADEKRRPIVEKVWQFAEEFTGKELDWEDALMNLFFNKNMYEAFLLSRNGENLHEFQHLLMTLPVFVQELGKDYADSPEKKAQLQKIFDDMKATMREPTIVAVLNWNYTPQLIMADTILSPEDLELIQQRKTRDRVLAQGSGGAYQRLAKDLLEIGEFTDEQKAFIQRTLNDPNASDRDKLVAQAMLDEADRRVYNIEGSQVTRVVLDTKHLYRQMADDYYNLNEAISLAVDGDRKLSDDLHLAIYDIYHTANMLYQKLSLSPARQHDKIALHIENLVTAIGWFKPFLGLDTGIELTEDLVDELEIACEALEDIAFTQVDEIADIITRVSTPRVGMPAFTIDPRAFFDGWERADEVQHIDDVLRDFAKEYGIPADQMYVRVLDGITKENFDKLQGDMAAMGVDDYQQFVTRRLEQMLGSDYIVAPSFYNAYYNVEPFSFVNKKIAERYWTNYQTLLDTVYALTADYDANKGKKISAETHDLCERIVDQLAWLSTPASEYQERPELSPELFAKITKLWKALNTKSDAEVRKYVASKFGDFDEIRLGLMNELEISMFGPEPIDNYVTDFKIAKKIPANKVLISELTTGTREEQRQILTDILTSDVPVLSRDGLVGYVMNRWSMSEEDAQHVVNNVDPYTGEPLFGEDGYRGDNYDKYIDVLDAIARIEAGEDEQSVLADLPYQEYLPTRQGCRLVDLLGITGPIVQRLEGWQVYVDEDLAALGETNTGGKLIRLRPDDGIVETLAHEINHALQDVMGLSPGGNTDIVKNRKLFTHLLANYREYVEYVAYRSYSTFVSSWLEQEGNKPFTSAPKSVVECLSYCAYRLISGEMWAEQFDHNGRPVRGYARVFENGESYIVSPDGKERFELGGLFSLSTLQASYDPNAKISPELAGQALANALERVVEITRDADRTSYRASVDTRNTYHTAFTKGSASFLLRDMRLISDEAYFKALVYGDRITIDAIIKNPEDFLPTEFIQEMLEWRTDLSEGNVFYYLKDWIEEHKPGVSIDRTADTHEYILVNDNAFDDLLLPKMIAKAESEDATLAKKYIGTEATLGDFYSKPALRKINVSSELPVIIRSDVRSEFVVNASHPYGVIYINANENTRDVRLIDTLNHEFRHLQQRYNKLEGGFTLNINVTNEMVTDFEKHVPFLFEHERLKYWAQRAAGKEWKKYLIRQAIYRLDGGELNAFGINAYELSTKPIYVTYEAGKPVIFLPWYNAETGEGRHVTDVMAYREDDMAPELPAAKTKKTEPKKKKSSYTGERFKPDAFDLPIQTEDPDLEEGLRRRYVSKKQAEGTNLEFFTKKLKPGERLEMDPRLQDFVIKADLSRLNPVLKHAIERGTLNMQLLNGWLINEKTDITEIDNYTFGLLAKHIFKNKRIKTGKQLQQVVDKVLDGTWWASAIVLRGGIRGDGGVERVTIENLVKQNDLDAFMAFYNSLEGTKWKKAIDEKSLAFTRYYDKDGKVIQLIGNDTVQRAARIFAMRYFDGSLAGAHHVANTYRRAVAQYENEIGNAVSLDKSTKNKKGEDNRGTLAEQVTEKNRIQSDNIVRDLVALYEEEVGIDLDEEELQRMRTELVLARLRQEGWSSDSPELKAWAKTVIGLDNEELVSLYAQYDNDNVVGEALKSDGKKATANAFEYDPQKNRVNIVNRIKNKGRKLLRLIRNGEFAWDDLPNEVKELFEEVEVEVRNPKTKKTEKRKEYQLKASAYQVGRGRASLKGGTDAERRMTYSTSRDLREGTDKFKHDVSQILANEQLLQNAIAAINDVKKVRQASAKAVRSTIREVQLVTRETLQAKVHAGEGKNTVITVRKKRQKTPSDTPNHFTIVSNVEMPEMLRQILDTSFNEMADTRVQFASKDEEGNLYDKDNEKFESRLQHEITTWDAFYEANREHFLALTRTDVLAILDFFLNGATTFNGPAGKLAAFEIFTLGYIVDAARHDASGWHFSSAEIDNIEKLYEAKASALGSGLNAVSQMKKVINPLKKIQEAYFEDFNILPEESDRLVKAIERLEKATAKEDRERSITEVTAEINVLEDLIRVRDTRNRGWNKNIGQKLKNWRYTSMLSSPATWARNTVSNITSSWLIKYSDILGNVFTKKGYRNDQWNLSGVQVTPEVHEYVKTFFLDNEVFDPLYENISKYDDVTKIKKRQQEDGHTLLVQMISQALERKYAAEHRWDTKTMNRISTWFSKRISDKKFVRRATEKYFGKMLTVAMSKGQAKIDKGLSSEGALQIFAEAIILANNDYMHKRNWISDMFDSIKTTHPLAYQAITLWQPFASAGWNWFVESLKYSPMGLVTNIVRLCKLESNIAKVEELRAKGRTVPHSRFTQYLIKRDIGKGIIGGILWSIGAFLALGGVIRITEDDDDTFYIVAGDVKLDISEIFGSSSLLVGAAIVQRFVEQADGTKMNWDEVFGLFADQILGGFILTDLLDRHQWDTNAGEHVLVEIESFAKSYVPQFWQLFVRATSNAKIKYSPGVKGAFDRWVNSLIPTMPRGERRVNPYTGEMETKYALPFVGELLKGGVHSTGAVKILYSKVSDEEILAREYDVRKNPLTGDITSNGKKHKISDVLTLNQVYGKLNSEDLKKIKSQNHRVEMPNGKYKQLSWDQMSKTQRQNVIQRTFTSNAEIAKVYMWTQKMGHKYYASPSVYSELVQMGITRNVYSGDKGFVE